MRRWHWSLAIVLLGAASITGCTDEVARTKVKTLRDSVNIYVDSIYTWQEKKLFPAICTLEAAVNIPTGNRLCPGGPGTPVGAPPKPPPFPE